MSTPSTKGAIPLPQGTDAVSRANHVAELAQVDLAFALQSQADRPFYMKGRSYNAGLNQLEIVIGPGRVNVNGTIAEVVGDTTVLVAAPAVSTTYYVYVSSLGVYSVNTTGVAALNTVLLWTVTTANPVATGTLAAVDKRSELPTANLATGVTPSTYGTSSIIGTFAVGADGRITSAVNVPISATTTNIIDGAVTNPKLAANAVGTTNVIDGSITSAKLAASVPVRVPRIWAYA